MPTLTTSAKGRKTWNNDPLSFFVAGHHFSEGFKGFDERGEVTLQRESENRYDKEALAVYIGGTKVGYAPRPLNSFLCYFLRRSPATFELSSHNAQREYAEIQLTMKV